MKRIAINGMGRIGRASLKVILDSPELTLVALNDITPIDNIAYLIKYDSVHGSFDREIEVEANALTIGNREIPFFSEKDPANLPWDKMGVDVVIESTEVFTKQEEAQKHIEAGAKAVVISGPPISFRVPTPRW